MAIVQRAVATFVVKFDAEAVQQEYNGQEQAACADWLSEFFRRNDIPNGTDWAYLKLGGQRLSFTKQSNQNYAAVIQVAAPCVYDVKRVLQLLNSCDDLFGCLAQYFEFGGVVCLASESVTETLCSEDKIWEEYGDNLLGSDEEGGFQN